MLPPQTLYWVLFVLAWYVLMYFLLPAGSTKKLLSFGLWFGFAQACVIQYLGQVLFKFWRIAGDPTLLGIPVLTAVSWIPPAAIFARFFSWMKTGLEKAAWVLFFAGGTAIANYLQSLVGMWVNLRWNPFFTFLLALAAHSIMTGYLMISGKNILPEGSTVAMHRFIPVPAKKRDGEIRSVRLRKPLKIK